jgi:hypothetical protein
MNKTCEVIAGTTPTFSLPPPICEPIAPSLGRFHQVMRPTEALTISNIKLSTIIFNLDDMVGKHAVLRLSLGAAIAMHHGLAPATCPSDNLGSPGSELK